MNNTLSALIAFVGFLIVFSMLVQSVQEALKNVLKLKARVFERFFVTVYRKEFAISKQSASWVQRFKEYMRNVVRSEHVGEFEKRLERLRDMMVKADDLIANLRAALAEVKQFNAEAPDPQGRIQGAAPGIIQKVKAMDDLRLNTLLDIYDTFDHGDIGAFYKKIAAFLARFSEISDGVLDFDGNLQKEFHAHCIELLGSMHVLERKVSLYRRQIEHKLDSWLAQLNEEYRRNMLKWTVIAGAVIVIGFNADSYRIYKYLSVGSDVQAAIVLQAAEATGKALSTRPDELNDIQARLASGKLKSAREGLLSFLERLQKDFRLYGKEDIADDVRKLSEDIRSSGEQELRAAADKAVYLYMVLQKNAVEYQVGSLASLDLPLGWTAEWKAFSEAKEGFTLMVVKKTGGLFLTIFLITFGAPFWNDVLSALTGLKNAALRTPRS